MSLKVVLLAYGEMAPAAFRSLIKDFQINSIITPPHETSKGLELPVEKMAKSHKIPVFRTNSNQEIEKVVVKKKVDALVVCSYNKILPVTLLKRLPCINVHHGDLPRWRGRANLNWAIITGRKNVGLSFHEAIPELDAGNIFALYKIAITKSETIATLYKKVNDLVEKNLGTITRKVLSGFKGKPQIGKATYCCTRLPEDGLIDWNQTSIEIDRFIRALTTPFPGAFTFYDGSRMTVWSAELPSNPHVYEGRIPGRVIMLHKNKGVEILTGNSSIILKKVTYKNHTGPANLFIRTVKTSLGIDWVKLYEALQKI